MPDMLRRFFERSDRGKLLCLERQIINCAKARRLAEQAYMGCSEVDAPRFQGLLDQAEQRLDDVTDQLLEVEGK